MAFTEASAGLSASAMAVAATEARSARAFEAARRHSRLVRILRVVLPIGAFGAVTALILAALVRNFTLPIAGVSISSVSVQGSKVTMENPKLTGGRADGSSYIITSKRAIQDLKNPNLVELVDIDGDIGAKDQASTKLSATHGLYDTNSEKIQLSGVVTLKNQSYTVNLKSADVDFKGNVYKTADPVDVVTASGMTIAADSATAEDNATKLTFMGHVKTNIPGQQGGPAPQMKSSDR